jgi:hypothetical protein
MTAPHTHTLATVLVTLATLNVISLGCSIWLTAHARRLAAPARQRSIPDVQEVLAFTARPQGTIVDVHGARS